MNAEKPFKEDKNGLWYLDIEDIYLNGFSFNEVTSSYSPKRKFYHIKDVDNYIVKDTTNLPKYLNEYHNMKLLKKFKLNQYKFNDIDFPVGYVLDKKQFKGTIIPYYENSLSLKELSNLHEFEDLKKYYNQKNSDIYNLINLCLEVLKIIKQLYDENIIYVDIGAGNFLVYNNAVKIIDFEPGRVYFTEHKQRYLKLLLSNYNILVNYIWRHYGFTDMPYRPGESFIDAENNVKSLYKEKRRSKWNF